MHGLTLRQLHIDSWHVKFDLVVNAWESQGELVVWWEYTTALFDRETIAGLFDRYARLLRAVVAAPDAGIDDLEILSSDELALLAQTPHLPALELDFAR
jgi:non-ribosomal peptide synthetase component F